VTNSIRVSFVSLINEHNFRKKNQTPTLCNKRVAKKKFDTSAGKTYEEWKRLVTCNP
jgi:hypothetical protein